MSFYFSDFNNANEMLKSAIKSIMKPKYPYYKIFIPNFSYYDKNKTSIHIPRLLRPTERII